MKNTIIKVLSLGLLFSCLSVRSMETRLTDLPPEMHLEIVNSLTTGETVEEATDAIRNLAHIKNKKFYDLINHGPIITELINKIATQFTADPYLVAAYLRTNSAFQWLTKKIKEAPDSSTNALITAIQKANSNAVSFLLKAGANPNLGVNNMWPIDLAWKSLSDAIATGNKPSQESLEIYKALIKAGAKSGKSYGFTPHTDRLREEYGINLPPQFENPS